MAFNDQRLAKAYLIELDSELKEPKEGGKKVTVQFNPESLKVNFTNQIATQSGAGDQSNGTPSKQFVGAGTTKLSLQLWFDVTAPLQEEMLPEDQKQVGSQVDDVRKLTQEVAYFITPKPDEEDPKKFLPPGVSFVWGSFQFDGIMESLEESLEFFSSEGKPLRAGVTINLTQQKITMFKFAASGKNVLQVGTRPMTQVQAGATLQGLAASKGKGDNWQRIADANGIDNPRHLQPGQLIDMNPRIPNVVR
jgi:hypothetical protein